MFIKFNGEKLTSEHDDVEIYKVNNEIIKKIKKTNEVNFKNETRNSNEIKSNNAEIQGKQK